MKWILAMVIGALSGWVIVAATHEVAIASASGAAIGVLASIALLGTRPVRSVFKAAGAMAVGCLFGWLVSSLTGGLAIAMALGLTVGVLGTVAVAGRRPLVSLLKVAAAMGVGFLVGWGIGLAVGDHRLGMALAIPLGLPLLVALADTMAEPRRRPF